MRNSNRCFGAAFLLAAMMVFGAAPGAAQGWIEPGVNRGGFAVDKVGSEVRVRVVGRVAHFEVSEWFTNVGGRLAEGEYIYPLAGEAVFQGFSLYQGETELRKRLLVKAAEEAGAAGEAPPAGGRPLEIRIGRLDVDDGSFIYRDRTVPWELDARQVDLVISDMAPNVSGMSAVDQPRAMYLAELALAFAEQWLEPGGSFVVKVFHGEGFDSFVKQVRSLFEQVQVRKPSASRPRSREVYALATGYNP